MLGVVRFAAHPQKAVFQLATLEKFFKLPLRITRQFLSLLCHKRCERRVILIDDLIEKGLLGTMG